MVIPRGPTLMYYIIKFTILSDNLEERKDNIFVNDLIP